MRGDRPPFPASHLRDTFPHLAGRCDVLSLSGHSGLRVKVTRCHSARWLTSVHAEDVVLDLAPTRFIDSTGVGLLTRLRRQGREAGREFRLANVGQPVRHALELMQLETFFQMADSVAEAVQSIRAQQRLASPVEASGESRLEWHGDVTAVTGESIATAALGLIEARPGGSRLAVDLSDVAFVDSSGVGVMLKLKKAAKRRDVDLVYENASPTVVNVLKLTKLDEYLIGRRP